MKIIKLFFLICILEISSKIGFILSKKYVDCLNEYIIIEDILNCIESRIRYSQDNVIDILNDLSIQYNKTNFGNLFNDIEKDLKISNYSLYDIFNNNIEKHKYRFACNLEILNQLSKNLGRSDCEDQIKNINLLKDRIKLLISESKIKKEKNEKLYKNLGIICGIAISIILI